MFVVGKSKSKQSNLDDQFTGITFFSTLSLSWGNPKYTQKPVIASDYPASIFSGESLSPLLWQAEPSDPAIRLTNERAAACGALCFDAGYSQTPTTHHDPHLDVKIDVKPLQPFPCPPSSLSHSFSPVTLCLSIPPAPTLTPALHFFNSWAPM